MTALPRPLARAAAGGATLLVLGAGALALAAPASAHVSVNPREAPAGGFHKLSIRVPNESPTAGTVALAVSLPTDTPLAHVSVRPHAGWRAEVTRTKLREPVASGDLEVTEAVTRITWTAERGVRVAPGQFEEFDISVGPLPEGAETLSFPAVQTYDDGEVVTWDQRVTEGGDEPEHPVPVLKVTAAPQDSHHASTAVAALSGGSAAPQTSTTDETARMLGAGGLAVGVLGVSGAVATALASRSRRQA